MMDQVSLGSYSSIRPSKVRTSCESSRCWERLRPQRRLVARSDHCSAAPISEVVQHGTVKSEKRDSASFAIRSALTVFTMPHRVVIEVHAVVEEVADQGVLVLLYFRRAPVGHRLERFAVDRCTARAGAARPGDGAGNERYLVHA